MKDFWKTHAHPVKLDFRCCLPCQLSMQVENEHIMLWVMLYFSINQTREAFPVRLFYFKALQIVYINVIFES